MNINIKTIPESEQRKEVNGADWWWDENNDLQVRISPLSDWRYEALLSLHETIEAILCRHKGVKEPDVCVFDQEYDKTHNFDVDAGDEPDAPYVRQHCFATGLERVVCAELDVNWKTYDKELASTYPGPSKK